MWINNRDLELRSRFQISYQVGCGARGWFLGPSRDSGARNKLGPTGCKPEEPAFLPTSRLTERKQHA